MKKQLLCFYLSILGIFSVQAQTYVYHEFPDSSAMWNIESYQSCGLVFDTWKHTYTIDISGDTTIQNLTYHKLKTDIEVVESNGSCSMTGTWTIDGRYLGCIREDVANKMVYFVPPSDSVEQLLYDFNMNAGDTVRGYTQQNAFTPDVVVSIDSILIGSDYRKRWCLDPNYQSYLIEGIGSTYGLIALSPGGVTDADWYTISCFRQDGAMLYPDTSSVCNRITAIEDNILNSITAEVSPNPFHSTTTITLDNSFKEMNLKIYDLPGSLIQEYKIRNQHSLVMERNKLKSGIYFLQITNEHGQKITKKVIAD